MPDRDPIRELENFTLGGSPMDTLPAAEVRRRGDSMRRRRTAALAGGSALAVALVVAAPFTLAGGGGDGSSREPGFATNRPTASESASVDVGKGGWIQAIPSSFDLAVGYPKKNEDGTPVETEDGTGEAVELCGEPVQTSTGRVDSAAATYAGAEDHRSRSLALYRDDRAAEKALASVEAALGACDTYSQGGTDQVVTSTPSDAQLGDGLVSWTVRYRTGGQFSTGLTVVHVVRVGNALLFTSTDGEGGGSGESIFRAQHKAYDNTQFVVDDMNVFADDPSTVQVPSDAVATEPG